MISSHSLHWVGTTIELSLCICIFRIQLVPRVNSIIPLYQSVSLPVSMEHVVLITHVNVKTSGKDPTAIHLVSIFMYM